MNTLSNVIGIVKGTKEERHNHWLTMRELRSSLREMKRLNNQGDYDIAIDKEQDIYVSLMKEFLQKAA